MLSCAVPLTGVSWSHVFRLDVFGATSSELLWIVAKRCLRRSLGRRSLSHGRSVRLVLWRYNKPPTCLNMY